ncbi:MAG TPA: formate dehydrogenase subunit gamma [Burkholderiaceae bacterium]|nr:formate dehydrogenase subunit gamma [Burkholderiaceae bacterium]
MRYIRRYDDRSRMTHWAVVLLFFCAALSGLALFHPGLFFFSGLFGGGTWSRILHPFFGLLTVLAFVPLFAALWRDNRWQPRDTEWMRHSGAMMRGDKAGMPAVGRYNAGQKLVFWFLVAGLVVLLVTGFIFWQPYFADAFPILARRIAVVLHAVAAAVLVLAIIVHIYAGIWVRGTLRAMTRGTVTDAWARQNHPLWYREMTGGE